MAKLNSDLIKQIVAQRAATHVHTRFDDELLEKAQKEAGDVKRWKRGSKRKIKSGWYDEGSDSVEEVIEQLGEADIVEVLDPQKITGECIMRHFVNDWLSDELDPIVVTDPKDERILLISWHSD